MMPEEGKAIPDWQYVKSELLQSSFNADVVFAEFLAYGGRDLAQLRDGKKWVIDLWLKLKPKIDIKKKEYDILKKLDDFIYKRGKDLSTNEWLDCLHSLNMKLDDLGVTKIELPPKKAIKHPLLRGDRY